MAERGIARLASLAVAFAVLGLLALTVVTLLTAARPAPDRVQELSQQLRCPVCKSVSVAESPSDTATAMRQVVVEQVAAGRSDTEIIDFFRARYGDWVLLDPPRRGSTLPLWLAPPVVTVLGVAVVFARARSRSAMPAEDLTGPARSRVEAAVRRARRVGPDAGDEP